ncbi:MAG: hypothetical protein HN417_11345 [Desulfobacula sp.]|nr:hypothetical protein [Desulfobacula sp.]
MIKKKIKFTCVKDIRQALEIALEEKILPIKEKSAKKKSKKQKPPKEKPSRKRLK